MKFLGAPGTRCEAALGGGFQEVTAFSGSQTGGTLITVIIGMVLSIF